MNNNIFDNWHLGVTFGFRAPNGWYSTEEAKREAEAIARSGADWVVLVVTVFQDTPFSTRQYKDFRLTPSDEEVKGMINYLHSLGLKVQLRPMLETMDGGGRLTVWFPKDDVDGERIPGTTRSMLGDWFKSMTDRAVYYAGIAEETGCEIYCLDSELDRLVNYNSHWKNVVAEVRRVYSGAVTSCHTTHMGLIDFEKVLSNKNHWFYDLDLLSLSCYHMASKVGMTKEDIAEGFKGQVERFRRLAEIYEKPILFGEFGSNLEPYEQANYMSVVVDMFSKEDWWFGFYWWKWDEQVRPVTERTWTMKDRPAAGVLREWSHKDRSRNQ